jgi:hypothetical protein
MRESKLTSEHPTGFEKERERELCGKISIKWNRFCLAAFIEVRYVPKREGQREPMVF